MTYRRTNPRLLPPAGTDDNRLIAEMFRNIYSGRLDWGGDFSCRSGTSSTTITDIRCDINKVIQIIPLTAHAATALTTTYIKEADYLSGKFIVTHPSDANGDKSFRYIIMG